MVDDEDCIDWNDYAKDIKSSWEIGDIKRACAIFMNSLNRVRELVNCGHSNKETWKLFNQYHLYCRRFLPTSYLNSQFSFLLDELIKESGIIFICKIKNHANKKQLINKIIPILYVLMRIADGGHDACIKIINYCMKKEIPVRLHIACLEAAGNISETKKYSNVVDAIDFLIQVINWTCKAIARAIYRIDNNYIKSILPDFLYINISVIHLLKDGGNYDEALTHYNGLSCFLQSIGFSIKENCDIYVVHAVVCLKITIAQIKKKKKVDYKELSYDYKNVVDILDSKNLNHCNKLRFYEIESDILCCYSEIGFFYKKSLNYKLANSIFRKRDLLLKDILNSKSFLSYTIGKIIANCLYILDQGDFDFNLQEKILDASGSCLSGIYNNSCYLHRRSDVASHILALLLYRRSLCYEQDALLLIYNVMLVQAFSWRECVVLIGHDFEFLKKNINNIISYLYKNEFQFIISEWRQVQREWLIDWCYPDTLFFNNQSQNIMLDYIHSNLLLHIAEQRQSIAKVLKNFQIFIERFESSLIEYLDVVLEVRQNLVNKLNYHGIKTDQDANLRELCSIAENHLKSYSGWQILRSPVLYSLNSICKEAKALVDSEPLFNEDRRVLSEQLEFNITDWLSESLLDAYELSWRVDTIDRLLLSNLLNALASLRRTDIPHPIPLKSD